MFNKIRPAHILVTFSVTSSVAWISNSFWCGEKELEAFRKAQLAELTSWRIMQEAADKAANEAAMRKKADEDEAVKIIDPVAQKEAEAAAAWRKAENAVELAKVVAFEQSHAADELRRRYKLVSNLCLNAHGEKRRIACEEERWLYLTCATVSRQEGEGAAALKNAEQEAALKKAAFEALTKC